MKEGKLMINTKTKRTTAKLECYDIDPKVLINNSKRDIHDYLVELKRKDKRNKKNQLKIDFLSINPSMMTITPLETDYDGRVYTTTKQAVALGKDVLGMKEPFAITDSNDIDTLTDKVINNYVHWYQKRLKKQKEFTPKKAMKLLHNMQFKALFTRTSYTYFIANQLDTVKGETIDTDYFDWHEFPKAMLVALSNIHQINNSTLNCLIYNTLTLFLNHKEDAVTKTLAQMLFAITNKQYQINVIYDCASDYNNAINLATHAHLKHFMGTLAIQNSNYNPDYLFNKLKSHPDINFVFQLQNKLDLENEISAALKQDIFVSDKSILHDLKMLFTLPNVTFKLTNKGKQLIETALSILDHNFKHVSELQTANKVLRYLLKIG